MLLTGLGMGADAMEIMIVRVESLAESRCLRNQGGPTSPIRPFASPHSPRPPQLSFLGPAIRCDWGTTSAQEASVSMAVFLGMMAGSNIFGEIADKFGVGAERLSGARGARG